MECQISQYLELDGKTWTSRPQLCRMQMITKESWASKETQIWQHGKCWNEHIMLKDAVMVQPGRNCCSSMKDRPGAIQLEALPHLSVQV